MAKKSVAPKKSEPAKPVKPVTVAAESADPMAWVRAHQKLVLGIAGAAVVVALGTWLVIETGQRRELRAAEQLDRARSIAESGNLPLAASELQKIIETFSGTNAATEAVVTLNQVRMVNGQSELAVVSLQEYLKTNPKKIYKVPAQGLLGEALENANRPEEAGQAYLGAANDADLDYLKAQYLLSAGRAFVNAGNAEEAFKALSTIVEKYPDTGVKTEATVRLSELTQGRMTLAK
ncbi:MAG TPA: tetratricopeptide repeat protein [Gemmatimonadales bacterium]|nr:tetratricopeptide repeat protein [Gemmatimonadales bacterium]